MDLSKVSTEELKAEIKRRALIKAAETRAKKKAEKQEDESETIEVQGRIVKVWKESPWFFTKYQVEIDEDDYYKYVKRDEHSEWYRKTDFEVDKRFFTFKTRPMLNERCILSVKVSDFNKCHRFDRFSNTKIIAVRRLNVEGD